MAKLIKVIFLTLSTLSIACLANEAAIQNQTYLDQEFEKSFKPKYDCNSDFARCVQERKTAREKFYLEHGTELKRQNSFVQETPKEEPKRIQEHAAEGLIEVVNKVMGIERLQAQIISNSEKQQEIYKESARKIKEKHDNCNYWQNNQDGSERKKEFRRQYCGY